MDVKLLRNAILGRNFLNALGGILSTLHQVMKCPAENADEYLATRGT